MNNERSRRRRNDKPPTDSQIPCDELGPDDGIDPRLLFRNEHGRSKDDRKVHQLCAQAARALQFTLAGTCRDPVLQQLDVASVRPAPDAKRLRVTVCPFTADVDVDDARARLAVAHGLLRSAVAAAVRRRKVPELVFDVAPFREASS